MGEDGKREDQHKAGLKQVAQQVGAIDAVTAVSELLNSAFLVQSAAWHGCRW